MARRHGRSISVWLSTDAEAAFTAKAQRNEHTRSDVLRCLVAAYVGGANVAPQLYAELRSIRDELQRISVNLNRAVKQSNTYRRPTRALGEQAGLATRAVAKLLRTLRRVDARI